MKKDDLEKLVVEASSSIRESCLDKPENHVLLEKVIKRYIVEAVRATELESLQDYRRCLRLISAYID